jgi:hypothetical protein
MAPCTPVGTAAEAIERYILAKDRNHPHLARGVFASDAVLDMDVRSGSISFPPRVEGDSAILEVLVARFAQAFENVHTFCIAARPSGDPRAFSCPWVVGMSEKSSGGVRIGSGRYDWRFAAGTPAVERLRITIERMELLAPEALDPVMAWLGALPYPWCPAGTLRRGAPELPAVASVIAGLQAGVPGA